MELQTYINNHPDCISEFKKLGFKVNTFKDLKIISYPYDKKPLYEGWSHLLLSKKHSQNQKLLSDFNEWFKKLKEQGKVKAYLNEITDPRKDLYKNSLKGLRFLKKWKK